MNISIPKLLKSGLILVLTASILFMIGCGQQAEEKPTVKLVYVNWAEGIAMTNLAAAILENKMGYTVETQVADVGPVYTSIAKGDNDAFLDAWLPVTHASYMEEYGHQMIDLGHTYEGARIGLVVPAYVTIDSITQMNEQKEQFDGKIIGIDAGAGIMKATNRAIETYDLDFELVSSSGPAMTAQLKNAINKNEWIVVTGWKPHWKFARWDLKFLADPEKEYGAVENTHCVARKGIHEDMPMVADFLTNFHMTDQTLGDLMGQIADADKKSPREVATEWMNNHPEVINEWIPEE